MRRIIVLATVVLAIAGCGGDQEPSAVETSVPGAGSDSVDVTEALAPATLTAIDQAIAALGPKGAIESVALALNFGYGVDQIVAAMGDGTLSPAGSISGVVPAGPPAGVLSVSPSAQGEALVVAAGSDLAFDDRGFTLEQFTQSALDTGAFVFLGWDRAGDRQAARDAAEQEQIEQTITDEHARAAIGAIVMMAEAGYDLDQMIDLFLDPDQRMVAAAGPIPGVWCPVMMRGDAIIRPVNATALADGDPCLAAWSSDPDGATADTGATEDGTGDEPAPGLDTTAGSVVLEGSVQPSPALGAFGDSFVIHESRVEAVVSEDTIDLHVDVTFEAVWVFADENNPECRSTNRFVMRGTGPLVDPIRLELVFETAEVLAISGCEADADDDDDGLTFVGSIAAGELTGTIEPFFEVFAAAR